MVTDSVDLSFVISSKAALFTVPYVMHLQPKQEMHAIAIYSIMIHSQPNCQYWEIPWAIDPILICETIQTIWSGDFPWIKNSVLAWSNRYSKRTVNPRLLNVKSLLIFNWRSVGGMHRKISRFRLRFTYKFGVNAWESYREWVVYQ